MGDDGGRGKDNGRVEEVEIMERGVIGFLR